jgi:hypothetical protein
MYAISIHQPYADLIASGSKTIETRAHARFRCLVGQRIAIHATKRKQQPAYVPDYPPVLYNPQYGNGIVATAFLDRVEYPLDTNIHGAAACCACDGCYGYWLTDGRNTLAAWQRAIGVGWVPVKTKLKDCVPPVYAEYIGRFAARQLSAPAQKKKTEIADTI